MGVNENQDRPEVGERLRGLRLARGETLEQAAEAAGISYQLLQMIESGKRPNPTLTTLVALADHYGVLLDELVTIQGEKLPAGLERLVRSGTVDPPLTLEELARLRRGKLVIGREPTAQDYSVLLHLLRSGPPPSKP